MHVLISIPIGAEMDSRFWNIWSHNLPPEMVLKLQMSGKLTIWEGDVTLPNCGLTKDQLDVIHHNVSIFVHSASSINLQLSLANISRQIVYPSLAIARIALGCSKLEKFVYVSTAYASAFFRGTDTTETEGPEAVLKEDVRTIRSVHTPASTELSDLETYGTTPEFTFVQHPFSYSYAKHLTERLLLEMFDEAQLGHRLLVFRPSCIGPAESKPYPFYELPGSSPVTTIIAMVAASPPVRMKMSSYLSNPSEAVVDEIPVDMVVNRLIAHVAFGSSGCVHAVSSTKRRRRTEEWWTDAMPIRRFWWGRPRIVWTKENWKSDNLCKVAKLFVLLGCSFTFEDLKTEAIWDKMNQGDREKWPLWQCQNLSALQSAIGRRDTVVKIMGFILSKLYGLPTYLTWLFIN